MDFDPVRDLGQLKSIGGPMGGNRGSDLFIDRPHAGKPAHVDLVVPLAPDVPGALKFPIDTGGNVSDDPEMFYKGGFKY
jgi:hypothetical protein